LWARAAPAWRRNTTKIVLFRPKRLRRPGKIDRYFSRLGVKFIT
jgi:hypothetical protein